MKKYRIHLVYDVQYWAYHSTTTALIKYAPEDMEITHSNRLPRNLKGYDLVVVLPIPKAKRFYQQCKQQGVKVILAVFIQLPHFLEYFEEAVNYCDYIIFNTPISYEYFRRKENTVCLPQGVEYSVFYDEKKPRKDAALLVSSEHFKVHKGTEIAALVPNIDVLITDSTHPKYTRDEMRSLYNQYKVYCCLSEFEGTPTPGLESALCGCTVVSTPVGNMPELIEHGVNGLILANRDPDYVELMVQLAIDNYESYSLAMSYVAHLWSWEYRSQGYYDYFRTVV